MRQIKDDDAMKVREMRSREQNLIKTINHLTKQIETFKLQIREQRG